MKALMTFPVRILLAAEICSGNEDVRNYLNGVCIEDKYVVATNGHRLVAIPHEQEVEADLFPITIPIETVVQLRKMLGQKERNNSDVTLFEVMDGVHYMETGDKTIAFKPVDGTFPNWATIIPRRDAKVEFIDSFHWDYMADFVKINQILSGGTSRCSYSRTEQLIPHGLGGAEVRLSSSPNTLCVLMPKRSSIAERDDYDLMSEAQAAVGKDRSNITELTGALEVATDTIAYLTPEEFDDDDHLRNFTQDQTDRRDLIAKVKSQ